MRSLIVFAGLLAALTAFVLFPQRAEAQGGAAPATTMPYAAGQEGTLTIRHPKGRAVFEVTFRNGTAISVSAVTPKGPRSLAAAGPAKPAPAQNCSCGHVCWEDQQQQMSVCVCKSCGGDGGTIRLEDVLVSN